VFALLWITEYGERKGMKRFLADYDGNDQATVVAVAVEIDTKKA
jgi:hypothetical protein